MNLSAVSTFKQTYNDIVNFRLKHKRQEDKSVFKVVYGGNYSSFVRKIRVFKICMSIYAINVFVRNDTRFSQYFFLCG